MRAGCQGGRPVPSRLQLGFHVLCHQSWSPSVGYVASLGEARSVFPGHPGSPGQGALSTSSQHLESLGRAQRWLNKQTMQFEDCLASGYLINRGLGIWAVLITPCGAPLQLPRAPSNEDDESNNCGHTHYIFLQKLGGRGGCTIAITVF